ncbi:predicted protein [Arabidopsis lyrata subsp. lyrata]|uniref:Predicted protein n=1 Tax=Arabidopsis lyrata subsp. lyrata TaxID=81972 RepID=D7KSS9_ARALL|nr:predicted protein [Arabidopsis lyrata subsp. lyrata]
MSFSVMNHEVIIQIPSSSQFPATSSPENTNQVKAVIVKQPNLFRRVMNLLLRRNS